MKKLFPILALFAMVAFTLPASSEAVVLSSTCGHIDPSDQIKLGECLFNFEEFEGNGRTCASCHPPANNFTIDPKFIKTLPANDKLFVFEDLANFPGLQMCRDTTQNGLPGGFPNGVVCNSDADCGGLTCENLEDGVLMRKYGLINENVDGLNRPGRKRGVPHTLSMSTSLTPQNRGDDPGEQVHATGWSGDGAPGVIGSVDSPFTGFCDGGTAVMCQGATKAAADGMCVTSCDGFAADGSLKAFSIGAVIQHATKDLRRRVGTDFRLPTEEELEAMAAYQLAQGRQADDANIRNVVYKNEYVNEGRDQFFNFGNTCRLCHANAGANSIAGGRNDNFNTGAEAPTNPHFLEMVGAQPDGGFSGTSVNGFCTVDNPAAGGTPACFGTDQATADASCLIDPDGPPPFGGPLPAVDFGPCVLIPNSHGDGKFNTPPLVEMADTAPFMHNNAINTVEAAIAFYQTNNFARGGGFAGGQNLLGMPGDTVGSIAAWLRTINAVENIRLAVGMLETAEFGCNQPQNRNLVRTAMADTEDAWQVLEGSEYKLFGDAVALLKVAYNIQKSLFGSTVGSFEVPVSIECTDAPYRHSRTIRHAINHLQEVRNLIVDDTPVP